MPSDNEVTTISKIHAGASLNGDDFQFINHHLGLGIRSSPEGHKFSKLYRKRKGDSM